jgi:hypothetical protein
LGQVTVSITKRTPFRDSVQEFSNVYTYGSVGLNPQNDAEADQIIDPIVAYEKSIHSTDVTFLKARMWTSGGTKATNNMIRTKTLSGTGSGSTYAPGLDKERAVLIQIPAGTDSRGRPVKLRKWYHVCGNIGSVGITASINSNTTGFSTTDRNTIASNFNAILRLNSDVWGLMAESGRERTDGGQAACHRYLEHHQLGDQWRAV